MEKSVLWANGIGEAFTERSEDQLYDFLELLHCIREQGVSELISEEELSSAKLWDWLSAKDQVELNDIKRELTKRINKARCIEAEPYQQALSKVGRQELVKTLVLSFAKVNIYYISTILEYYAGLQSYLAQEKKDAFCHDLQECFSNIFFCDGIEGTVNTLNRRFEEIRGEIVDHLAALDRYHGRFEKLLEAHKSYREIAQAFSADMGIECSPQSGRDGVQSLKAKYFNDVSGQDEVITCELHTKFNKFNIDREKQDRIYFFPGKIGIKGGKIIVKHIGTHL